MIKHSLAKSSGYWKNITSIKNVEVCYLDTYEGHYNIESGNVLILGFCHASSSQGTYLLLIMLLTGVLHYKSGEKYMNSWAWFSADIDLY